MKHPSPACIQEPTASRKILGNFDVVVVGGGIAGAAAALAAARMRSGRVALLERYCSLGGLATIGNVTIYLPLCDGRGHQVIGGISEEFARLAVQGDSPRKELHVCGVPAAWNNPHASLQERAAQRYETSFHPAAFGYRLEQLLLREKVTVFYDSRFSTVVKENDRISAVIFESKSGRCALTCRAVVDATGSADVCLAAGEKVISDGRNSRCGWFYYLDADGKAHLHMCSDDYQSILFRKNPARLPVYREDSVDGVTAQIMASRRLMMDTLERLSATAKGELQVLRQVEMPTFRMSRRLAAATTLRPSQEHHWFRDTVGMTGDWRNSGPIYCLPFRALAAPHTANLMAAGRCISATGEAWEVTRVIPTAALTGEIAGTACAMLSQDAAADLRHLSISKLQKTLRRNGNILEKNLLKNP